MTPSEIKFKLAVIVKGKDANAVKNLWTTLAGLGAGALNLFANGTNWKQILASVGLAALGLLSKDFNTVGAGPTATKR